MDSEENRDNQVEGEDFSNSTEPVRVLLVDDSLKNRRMARDVLGEAGCSVMTAADGFDALAKVVAHKPDIVFADTVLPRLDGFQTCALIRNNVDFQNVTLIVLSGGPQPFDRDGTRMNGIDSSLSKPLTREALLTAIQQYGQDWASVENSQPSGDQVIT